jgi:outer membrane lipoprotein SlyB
MKTLQMMSMTLLVLTALTTGCANTDSRSNDSSHAQSQPPHSGVAYGVIETIDVTHESNNDIGAGALIGGVVGGILGHQVGGGSGNDVATIAGAAGGAVVGHQIEKKNKQQDVYRIQVKLEHGGYQVFTQQNQPDFRVGDRVLIENNRLNRY